MSSVRNKTIKTICELQAEIEGALARLSGAQLPPGLEALQDFVPPRGMSVRVSLRHSAKQRQIRRNADASSWNPLTDEIVISYELDEEPDEQSDEQLETADVSSAVSRQNDPLAELVKSLDAAERDPRFRDFVGIKAFRDQYLVAHGGGWVLDAENRRAVLARAISQGFVLRNSVPNPKVPNYPTTAIRVNRDHPQVKDLLMASAAERSAFKPISIRGNEMSDTVLAERR